MKRLRQATATQHQRTEAAMPSEALLNGTLGTAAYARLLARQFLIYQNLEAHLATALSPYPELAGFFQAKTPWLAADLQQLDTPRPPALPHQHPQHTAAQLLGLLYVLEGSMLGGQVILKSLLKNPHLRHLSHSFYRGNGPRTGARWQQFRSLAVRTVSPEAEPEAVAAANHAFRFFLENLSEGGTGEATA